jgi:hypothetical protein
MKSEVESRAKYKVGQKVVNPAGDILTVKDYYTDRWGDWYIWSTGVDNSFSYVHEKFKPVNPTKLEKVME